MFIDLEKSGLNFGTINDVAKYLTDTSIKVRCIVFCEFQGVRVGSAHHYMDNVSRDYDYFDEVAIIIENFYKQKLDEKDSIISSYDRSNLALFNLFLNAYPQHFETLGYDRDDIQRLIRQAWRQEDFAAAKIVIKSYFAK